MMMIVMHDLSIPAPADENREYRQFPNGAICLYIRQSIRSGVYCYQEDQWEYDARLTSEFEWDRPYGELCAFLPSDVPLLIRLDAFLSYTESMLLVPDCFLHQDWDRLWNQYVAPAKALLEQLKEKPEFGTTALADIMEASGEKGEEYFSVCWRDGTVKKIIDIIKESIRPAQLSDAFIHSKEHAEKVAMEKEEKTPSVQAGKNEQKVDRDDEDSYQNCLSYFRPKRGLANDFIFPGKLLDELSPVHRQKVENMIVSRCLQGGDKRFFNALAYCKFSNLNDIFTGKAIQKIITPETRANLLHVLYQSTKNPEYLEQMIRMSPGYDLSYYYVCDLIEDIQGSEDYLELMLESSRYQLIWHAVKTISIIRAASGWYKNNPLRKKWGHKKYKEINQLSLTEIKYLLEPGEWSFEGLDDLMIFYRALAWNYQYQESQDQKYLQNIMNASLISPEVYDVLRYMINTKIITREVIKEVLNSKKKEPQDVFQVIEIRKESDIVSDFSAYADSKAIVEKTIWPIWKDGYEHEEADLAECFRSVLEQCREEGKMYVSFPCGSKVPCGSYDGDTLSDFSGERIAEIALWSVFHEGRNHLEKWSSGKIRFVCKTDIVFQIYMRTLKEMIIDQILLMASPESEKGKGNSIDKLIYLLGKLQWNNPGFYNHYVDSFETKSKEIKHDSNDADKTSDYARSMNQWDFDTCLAYLIILLRLAYWSGGLENPFYAQVANGTVRRVLLRMKKLLKERS